MSHDIEPIIQPRRISPGCLGTILVCICIWAVTIWFAHEYGRKQGCKTDAEVVAALQALHQPSIEITP